MSIFIELYSSLDKINYYSATQFTNPSESPTSIEIENDGRFKFPGMRGNYSKAFLYDIYTAFKSNSDKYNDYLSLINQNGIGLVDSLDFKEVEISSLYYTVRTGGKLEKKEKKKVLVIPQILIGNNILSPSQLSEGTYKTLALLFYLVTDTSSLLMIEEPEVCVHHGLLGSIMDLIINYSKEKQIVISTHSDTVLDNLDIENIFVVYKDKINGTKIKNIRRSLKAKELHALRNYLENEGSLGEYWKHGDLESD